MSYEVQASQLHSPAWVAVTKIQFVIACCALSFGIWYLPVEPWVAAYLVMANLLLLSSTVALTKTLRDLHEGGRMLSKVEEARVERILAHHDPMAS